MPKNASLRADGFRIYAWEGGDTPLHHKYKATEPTMLLSVTSISRLAGEPPALVAWKISNVVNIATGVRKVVRVGPRGGIKDAYVPDGEFPGEFVARVLETKGDEKALSDVRTWLRQTADEPRDVAAIRGSVVHAMIEMGLPLDIVTPELIKRRIEEQWASEQRKKKVAITDDDINFVRNSMRQYWKMRDAVPFVLVAQEPQVYNLTAGYAGSADAIIWFLPDEEDREKWQLAADRKVLDISTINKVGGTLAVGDWKTSKAVQTGHVVQTTAYMTGEFIGEDGVIDDRLSKILEATTVGMVIHIRPDNWEVSFFDWDWDVAKAFIGSVAYARFLAQHPTPDRMFSKVLKGGDDVAGE